MHLVENILDSQIQWLEYIKIALRLQSYRGKQLCVLCFFCNVGVSYYVLWFVNCIKWRVQAWGGFQYCFKHLWNCPHVHKMLHFPFHSNVKICLTIQDHIKYVVLTLILHIQELSKFWFLYLRNGSRRQILAANVLNFRGTLTIANYVFNRSKTIVNPDRFETKRKNRMVVSR